MPEDGKVYNVTLSFYADDNTTVNLCPEAARVYTGDGVPLLLRRETALLAWCLAALISVGAMAFILAPQEETRRLRISNGKDDFRYKFYNRFTSEL